MAIRVESKVDAGTIFTLYFPVTREGLSAPQQSAPIEIYMGNGEALLVVDDIAEQREIAVGLLARLEYDAHAVFSGAAASMEQAGKDGCNRPD